MKILEIIKESIEDGSTPESNAEDILYLLDNVGMRPEELADLANSLKQIVGDQQDIGTDPELAEPSIIANQPPAEEPVTAEPEAEEPLETDVEPEETELQERTQALKRKKVVKASTYREQIEQYLSQITNDEDLKELN